MMMSKRMKIAALTAVLLAGGAVGAGMVSTSFAADGKELIGVDRAAELALAVVDGTVESVELEKKRGVTYYEVDIERSNRDYDVHIHAYSGKTLNTTPDDDDDDGSGGIRNSSASSSSASRTEAGNSGADGSGTASGRSASMISAEEAGRIAAAYVGGTVVEIERDNDDGVRLYEVKLKTSRGTAEVDVHAYTGQVLSLDNDDLDDDDDFDDEHDDDLD